MEMGVEMGGCCGRVVGCRKLEGNGWVGDRGGRRDVLTLRVWGFELWRRSGFSFPQCNSGLMRTPGTMHNSSLAPF